MSEQTKTYRVTPLSNDGGFFYEQVASNGRVLNVSEAYTRRRDAVRAILDANPEPRDIEVQHEYETVDEVPGA